MIIMRDVNTIIFKLKYYFNRPRPHQYSELDEIENVGGKSPSYPSGHSAQGFLIGLRLGDKYPRHRSAFKKLAKKISYRRRVAHVHYKSDSKFGELIGKTLHKHIKQNQS